MSRLTKQDFHFLLDNFKNCLAGWKTTFLNAAGRTTLIRSKPKNTFLNATGRTTLIRSTLNSPSQPCHVSFATS